MANDYDTVEEVFEECEAVVVWDFPNGPMEYARRFLAAHKREIESLKWKIENYMLIIAAKDEELAKCGEIIVQLAGAMKEYMDFYCKKCGFHCKAAQRCDRMKSHSALLKRALKAVK